ncbi:MAG: gliding motility-associated C-terminal domain-containing protein [Bacteroidota bacterium]
MKIAYLVLLFISFNSVDGFSQCTTFISSFPYSEGFESTSSWTAGGVSSDWAWGTPNHPLISSAGGGNKSWCIGGLNGSSYNDEELSYLMSPCFDFTNLDYPWVSFKIFWETEQRWDGLVFQYALNNTDNWINVGSFNDPVNCLNENWYNHNNVFWLTDASPKHGWTGRIDPTSGSCQGGNGSEEWLTAKHCMSQLAGLSNVRFRFLFGSGNSCNDFDGIAIDDILIENTTPTNANFSYTCLNSNDVSFTNLSTNCSTTYLWDFGDPASGNSNNATSNTPIHTFSSPGTYTVTLTSNGPCNQPGVFTQTIKILPNTITSTNVNCFGENNGSASVVGSTGSSYSWNTNPVQTSQVATNLSAGNYVVTISESNACSNSGSVTITEPDDLVLSLTSSASCIDICNGSLGAILVGGTSPYTYTWSNLGSGQNFNGSVCVGDYSLHVSDSHGCEVTDFISIASNPNPVILCDSALICIGSTATLTANGADFYSWSPPGNLNTFSGSIVEASPLITTTYTIEGTSIYGCKSEKEVTVFVNDIFAPKSEFSFLPLENTIFDTEVFFQNLSSGSTSYYWNFNNLDSSFVLNPTFKFPENVSASYQVCLAVNNDYDCPDTSCQIVKIKGVPSVYIPNSFSPDNNGINDLFFPVISDITTEKYQFTIYNRWGEKVFFTSSFQDKWDGTYQDEKCESGIYMWKMNYLNPDEKEIKELEGYINLER